MSGTGGAGQGGAMSYFRWVLGLGGLLWLNVGLPASLQAEIAGAPAAYRLWLAAEDCDAEVCNGPFTALVQRPDQPVAQHLPWQTEADALEVGQLQPKPYGSQSSLVVRDVDFDGQPDVMVYEGNSGPYSGPTYAVYLYSSRRQAFVLNNALTELARTGLGLFAINDARHELTVFQKSGCCWHLQTSYQVRPGGRLMPVRAKEEGVDASGEWVDVIRTRWRNGRPKSYAHRYSVAEYYRQP